MQFLAGLNTLFNFLNIVQASILSVFGLVVVVSAVLFIAAYNNFFIESSLNKLSKKMEKVNEKLKDRTLTSEERLDLEKQREDLEQKAKNKLSKAFNAVKTSSKRLKKLNIYLEKHAEKYPNLLYTYGPNIKTLKQLYDTSILENGKEEKIEPTTLEEVEESFVQPVLQKQVEVEEENLNVKEEKTTEEEKVDPIDLSADEVIYRLKKEEDSDDLVF